MLWKYLKKGGVFPRGIAIFYTAYKAKTPPSLSNQYPDLKFLTLESYPTPLDYL